MCVPLISAFELYLVLVKVIMLLLNQNIFYLQQYTMNYTHN